MNRYLANYIFANETLYNVLTPSPVIKSEIIKKTETIEQTPQEKLSEPAYFEPTNDVLILTNKLNSSEKTLLSNILKAIGKDFESIDLIETNSIQFPDYQSFINKNITRKFITFDIPLAKIGWSQMLSKYQTTTYNNIDFLLADALDKIDKNLDLKKVLWANLQKLFPKK